MKWLHSHYRAMHAGKQAKRLIAFLIWMIMIVRHVQMSAIAETVRPHPSVPSTLLLPSISIVVEIEALSFLVVSSSSQASHCIAHLHLVNISLKYLTVAHRRSGLVSYCNAGGCLLHYNNPTNSPSLWQYSAISQLQGPTYCKMIINAILPGHHSAFSTHEGNRYKCGSQQTWNCGATHSHHGTIEDQGIWL